MTFSSPPYIKSWCCPKQKPEVGDAVHFSPTRHGSGSRISSGQGQGSGWLRVWFLHLVRLWDMQPHPRMLFRPVQAKAGTENHTTDNKSAPDGKSILCSPELLSRCFYSKLKQHNLRLPRWQLKAEDHSQTLDLTFAHCDFQLYELSQAALFLADYEVLKNTNCAVDCFSVMSHTKQYLFSF